MSLINVNGKAYDSGDVTISLLGGSPNEMHEISYGDEQEHQINHGVNNEGTSWSHGKIAPFCTLTLAMADIVAIEDAAGGEKDLKKIKPFNITVAYLNDYNKEVIDRVRAKFQNTGREVDGGMNLKKQFTMFCLGIKYNVL